MALEDTDLMPWGKHAGKRMIDVPAPYLLWLYEEKKCHGEHWMYSDAEIIKLKGILRELQNDLDGVTDIDFNNALKTILR